MEKQVAWAAAISSSGLVLPRVSSVRAAQVTSSPPSTPLVTLSIRPLPSIRLPCQVASARRSVAIAFSFQFGIHGHGGARPDQRRKRAPLVGGTRCALERAGVDPLAARPRLE